MYENDVVKKRLYQIWGRMIRRCHNPNTSGYERYGAKGITVSDEWRDFESFYNDMSESYMNGLSIDRIDNSKGYLKENCKWSTDHEQSINKGMFKNNTTGYKGVYPTKHGTWKARITVNIHVVNLGQYSTKEEAYKGRQEAELYYFGYILDEGITQELLDKKAQGWKSIAEQHRDGEIELIGFVPSNSPRKAQPKNFGYGSPSVYSKVMAKQIRRLKYINEKLQSGDLKLTNDIKSEIDSLNKILVEARVQFDSIPSKKSVRVGNHTQQIKKNDYSILTGTKCFVVILILLSVYIALSAF